MSEPNEEPKIIVDEDWKSQVQKEKEQLEQQSKEQPNESADQPDFPPASFLSLLSMLGAQAMSGLGVLPDPMTGKPSVNKPLAKHCIDTLGILQEKTKGNLSEDEAAHLRDALHQLRMLYVSVQAQPDTPDNEGEGGSGSAIELP